MATRRLSIPVIAAYGAVSAPLTVIGLPLAIYIPPLYGELGLDLVLMATLLMIARFSDVITDPIIGLLSDKTRTRIGRRKPWLILGAPVMMIATYSLFSPPDDPSLWYFFFCVVAIYLASTLITIPYAAWGAEMSANYNERSQITALREQFTLAGYLIAVSIPMILSYFGQDELRPALNLSGVIICGCLPVVVAFALYFVPEPAVPAIRSTALPVRRYREGLRLVAKNGPFVRILIGYTGSVLGASMDSALSFFFAKHVLGAESSYALALFLMIIAGVVCVPLWRRLSTRIGKHMALIAAIIWYAGWAFLMPLLYFVPEWATVGFIFLQVMKGMSTGAFTAMTSSMAADVVDIDTARSGEQRTGLYFAIWGVFQKATTALAVSIALWAVGFFGFNATLDPLLGGQPGGNTFQALMALAIFYSVVPSCFKLATIPWLWNYPLTERRQARIRRLLESKAARALKQA